MVLVLTLWSLAGPNTRIRVSLSKRETRVRGVDPQKAPGSEDNTRYKNHHIPNLNWYATYVATNEDSGLSADSDPSPNI